MGIMDREYMRRSSHVDESSRPRRGQKLFRHVGQIAFFALAPILLVTVIWLEFPAIDEIVGIAGPGSDYQFPGAAMAAYPMKGKPLPGAISYRVVDMSGDGLLKVVRFRDENSGHLAAELYLPSGARGSVRIRPGRYRMHLMEGRRWLGPDTHFGKTATTFDFGVQEVGGEIAGLEIMPKSAVAGAPTISGFRF